MKQVFIRAIEEDPFVALVYADYLEENGQIEEATAIRQLMGDCWADESGYSNNHSPLSDNHIATIRNYGCGYGTISGDGISYGYENNADGTWWMIT